MSRSCLGLVLVLCLSRLGDVSVVSLLFLVMSRCCFGVVFCFFGGVLGIFQ